MKTKTKTILPLIIVLSLFLAGINTNPLIVSPSDDTIEMGTTGNSITWTQATTYSVRMIRSPDIVYAGETVIILVEVIDPIYGEEYTYASLSYQQNGLMNNYNSPEETIPNYIETTLTFIIGPFVEDDTILYKIYLNFLYADPYQSGWIDFTVGGTPSGLSTVGIVFIAIAGAVVIAAIVVIVFKLILALTTPKSVKIPYP